MSEEPDDAWKEKVDATVYLFNQALTGLFAPAIAACTTDTQAKAVRTILLSVLANKIGSLLKHTNEVDGKAAVKRQRKLINDIISDHLS